MRAAQIGGSRSRSLLMRGWWGSSLSEFGLRGVPSLSARTRPTAFPPFLKPIFDAARSGSRPAPRRHLLRWQRALGPVPAASDGRGDRPDSRRRAELSCRARYSAAGESRVRHGGRRAPNVVQHPSQRLPARADARPRAVAARRGDAAYGSDAVGPRLRPGARHHAAERPARRDWEVRGLWRVALL